MRHKKNGREAELYKKSAELFNKQGYDSTSVRQICRSLGIRESSLYYYIKGKEELLYNICERSLLQGLKTLEPISSLPLSPAAQLKKLIETHVQIIAETTNEQSTMLKELRSLSQKNQRKIITLRDRYQSIFRDVVKGCIKSGDLPKMNTDIATLAILGMMNWLIHWYSASGAMKSKDIANSFISLLLKPEKAK